MIALYARDTDPVDVAVQVGRLHAFAGFRGWQDPCIFMDTADNASEVFPGWETLRHLVEAGRIETVACVRLDRLSRDAETIKQWEASGLRIVAIGQ